MHQIICVYVLIHLNYVDKHLTENSVFPEPVKILQTLSIYNSHLKNILLTHKRKLSKGRGLFERLKTTA